MKKAYLQDLQVELAGSVTDAPEVLDYFATDGSIFTVLPAGVVYPRHPADVRRVVMFAATRARDGKPIGVTARGHGTDQSGGAIGDGLVMVLPAHLNRVLKLESKAVTVQPGMIYDTLEQVLHSHGLWLPPYPASSSFSTIGGAIANNASGEKSLKYGSTRRYVKSLKVVLADGSLIETRRLSARELNRRQGQSDFEGEIYRGLDGLLTDHAKLIAKAAPATSKNAAGYALWEVKRRDGSFDLTPLLVGSQGTLGIVTEATLHTLPLKPRTLLMVANFADLEQAAEAIQQLHQLGPSAMEMVDYHLLDFLHRHRPSEVDGLLPQDLPKLMLLVEFDDQSQLQQTLKGRRAEKMLKKLATSCRVATSPLQQEAYWRIRRSAAAVIWMNHGPKQALPVIEDGVVPLAKLAPFLTGIYKLLKKYDLEIAVWGHAGDANLHLQPFMDLSKKGDVDKLFALADEFYDLVVRLGGSTSGEHNDGRLRGPYLERLYGHEVYQLMAQTKQLFDPQNILNPGCKIGVTTDTVRTQLRSEYSLKHLYDHLPYT